jgi:hypothetical protein
LASERLSEVWIQLSPELLIHSDWERMPAHPQSWMDQRLSWVRRTLDAEPWKEWDADDWKLALFLFGLSVAVFGNLASFIAEVRRASAVR